MHFSIVIPVYNEAGNVQAVFEEITSVFAGQADVTVVFVDDGSDDGTAAVLAGLAREDPRLRIVTHAQNLGQSAALASGIRASSTAWVGTLDGDGQNDPRDLLRFLDAARGESSPAALYIGVRTRREDDRLRRLSSRIANVVRAALLGDDAPDSGCGIKLLRREIFLALPYFDHMHRFLPALVRREGERYVSMPVSHRPRYKGTSKYGIANRLGVGMVDLLGVMWLQRRRRLPAEAVGVVEESCRPI